MSGFPLFGPTRYLACGRGDSLSPLPLVHEHVGATDEVVEGGCIGVAAAGGDAADTDADAAGEAVPAAAAVEIFAVVQR